MSKPLNQTVQTGVDHCCSPLARPQDSPAPLPQSESFPPALTPVTCTLSRGERPASSPQNACESAPHTARSAGCRAPSAAVRGPCSPFPSLWLPLGWRGLQRLSSVGREAAGRVLSAGVEIQILSHEVQPQSRTWLGVCSRLPLSAPRLCDCVWTVGPAVPHARSWLRFSQALSARWPAPVLAASPAGPLPLEAPLG